MGEPRGKGRGMRVWRFWALGGLEVPDCSPMMGLGRGRGMRREVGDDVDCSMEVVADPEGWTGGVCGDG